MRPMGSVMLCEANQRNTIRYCHWESRLDVGDVCIEHEFYYISFGSVSIPNAASTVFREINLRKNGWFAIEAFAIGCMQIARFIVLQLVCGRWKKMKALWRSAARMNFVERISFRTCAGTCGQCECIVVALPLFSSLLTHFQRMNESVFRFFFSPLIRSGQDQ